MLDSYPLKAAIKIVFRDAVAMRWECDCSTIEMRWGEGNRITAGTTATKAFDAKSSSSSSSVVKHPFRIRRILDIDGLRGLAVATVVIYRYFDNVLPDGYTDVGIFFVLSGLLTTSLLVHERVVTERIDLKDF